MKKDNFFTNAKIMMFKNRSKAKTEEAKAIKNERKEKKREEKREKKRERRENKKANK